jgi:hypothetical protein
MALAEEKLRISASIFQGRNIADLLADAGVRISENEQFVDDVLSLIDAEFIDRHLIDPSPGDAERVSRFVERLRALQRAGGALDDSLKFIGQTSAVLSSVADYAVTDGSRIIAEDIGREFWGDDDSGEDQSTLFNISTRALAESEAEVLIGGFVVKGAGTKRVLIRARGPSLASAGIGNPLSDPALTLFSGADAIDANYNWKESAQRNEIERTGRAPSNDLEAALIAELSEGPYTVIVQDRLNRSGVGIFEVIDIDEQSDSRLFNISTRAAVETGDDVAIAGFVIEGNSPKIVLIRARGPSMTSLPLQSLLADPTLELFSGQTRIAANDDWKEGPYADLIDASGRAPKHEAEAAILASLEPGPYTAIVRGANSGTGIGIVEVIAVDEE